MMIHHQAYLLICLDERPNKNHIRWVHPSPSISYSHHQDRWNSHHFGSQKSHKKSQAANQTIFCLQRKRNTKQTKTKINMEPLKWWFRRRLSFEKELYIFRFYVSFLGMYSSRSKYEKEPDPLRLFPMFLAIFTRSIYVCIHPKSAKKTLFISTTKQKYPFWWPFNTSRITAAFR